MLKADLTALKEIDRRTGWKACDTTGYCIMGRTVLPYSHVWEEERQRWLKFRRALRKEDQVHLDRLFGLARLHLQAGVYASNPWPLESMLLSMLLEHQKALIALSRRLQSLEEPESGSSS